MMIKKTIVICLLSFAYHQTWAQVVDIKPQKPQIGDSITVIYHPGVQGAAIGKDADSVNIVFTYSTFYQLPWKLPMYKRGENWVASFKVEPYATYATFYFKSDTIIDKPAANKHYHIAVYYGEKRVENGFLHESYSLGAQMPKSSELPKLRLDLLEKELQNYPNNFEAKIRLLGAKMSIAKTSKDKLKYRREARNLIESKLHENPTRMRTINYATMGYLIIGENSRVDSIYQMIKNRYPNTEVGRELRIADLSKGADTTKMIAELETLLKKVQNLNEKDNETSIQDVLFKHYASEGKADRAVAHARKSLTKKSPYTARDLMDIADILTENKLAPDTAIAYAEQALKLVKDWPIGIIRYFHEFGYIRPFVSKDVREKTIAEKTSALYSLMAVNYLYKGDKEQALAYAEKAGNDSAPKESLMRVSTVYKQTGQYKKAFQTLWKVLLNDPDDTLAIKAAKESFLKFNDSESAFDSKIMDLEAIKLAALKSVLKDKMMNSPEPELNSIVDLDGKSVTRDMMKGKIIIIDFWATWCVPCMEELPYLQQVYDKYKDNPKLKFMVVNSGSNNTIKDAKNWKTKHPQYSFPLYYNQDTDIGEKVGFAFIPTVVLLDQNGCMQFKTVGFEGKELKYKIAAEIEVLLDKFKE